MKNQYFGDVNDYRKYGLLRAIQAHGKGRLLVAWMLTPDDGGRDGRFRSYLQEPDRWRHYDPELFDGLAGLLRSAPTPDVSLMERSALLSNARYYSAVVPDSREKRGPWQLGLLSAASKVDLVFVDPDNGIEVPSKPVGHKGSSKYVTWREIEGIWKLGRSVLIYQHFRREPREAFAGRMVSQLRDRTGAPFTEAFRTPHVLFLLAAHQRHESWFREVTALLQQRWKNEIKPMGLANTPLQPTGFAGG